MEGFNINLAQGLLSEMGVGQASPPHTIYWLKYTSTASMPRVFSLAELLILLRPDLWESLGLKAMPGLLMRHRWPVIEVIQAWCFSLAQPWLL